MSLIHPALYLPNRSGVTLRSLTVTEYPFKFSVFLGTDASVFLKEFVLRAQKTITAPVHVTVTHLPLHIWPHLLSISEHAYFLIQSISNIDTHCVAVNTESRSVCFNSSGFLYYSIKYKRCRVCVGFSSRICIVIMQCNCRRKYSCLHLLIRIF